MANTRVDWTFVVMAGADPTEPRPHARWRSVWREARDQTADARHDVLRDGGRIQQVARSLRETMLTREEWLCAGVTALRPLFSNADAPLPTTIHTSIGWPSRGGTSRKVRILGECWRREASADENCQIFISPVLITPTDVLDTLTHELVHVVTPGAGHKGQFIRVSKRIGLTEGKPKSAAAGADLRAKLDRIARDLGEWAHPTLTPSLGTTIKKQGTRMVKCECPDCGYTARTTRKWLDIGAPICPTCRVETEYDAETIAV